MCAGNEDQPSLRARAVDWLIGRIPTPLLVNPERVVIAVATAFIGVITLAFIRPASLSALLPHWVTYLWGATWLLGGGFGLLGNWQSWRAVEMAGHRLTILGAALYAIAIVVVVGTPGYVSIILLGLVIGLPSAIRLLVAAGSRRSRGQLR